MREPSESLSRIALRERELKEALRADTRRPVYEPLCRIDCDPDHVRIGALTSCTEIAQHPVLRRGFPLLTQALEVDAGARCGSAGDRLLQRPSCRHFLDPGRQCNKRAPGSGCSAALNPGAHAVFGASNHCHAVQVSDLCLALAALDARVEIDAGASTRMVPIAQFHRLPGTTPDLDANMQPGEVVTSIELPMSSTVFAAHFHYLKVGTGGPDSAPVSVAAALEVRADAIRSARIALGGVAHKPWRAVQAESALIGERMCNAVYWSAAAAALQPASRTRGHGFKVELIRQAIVRAVALAADTAGEARN